MFMMISRDVVPAFARQATALEAPLGMERRQLNLETCARDGQPDTSAVHIHSPRSMSFLPYSAIKTQRRSVLQLDVIQSAFSGDLHLAKLLR